MIPVNGFILAGGKSRRMGRDKALLDWHGRTLLDHLTEVLSSAADRVQVVGRAPLPDRTPGLGPLSGIATALAATDTDANLVIAVDLPLLTGEFLKYLRSRLETSDQPLLACKTGSEFPLCLGIRRSLLPELQKRLAAGKLSVQGFIENCGAEIILEPQLREAAFDPSMFRNINTLEDYRSAL